MSTSPVAQAWGGEWHPWLQKAGFSCGQFFLTAGLRLSSCSAKGHVLAEGLLGRPVEDTLLDSAPALQPRVPGSKVTSPRIWGASLALAGPSKVQHIGESGVVGVSGVGLCQSVSVCADSVRVCVCTCTYLGGGGQ